MRRSDTGPEIYRGAQEEALIAVGFSSASAMGVIVLQLQISHRHGQEVLGNYWAERH
ncbi:hypothetical protein Bra5_PD00678 (plasmid) [Rhizobium phaseoli Brasil 5]|nr:hypothetical protein Bra5_PD00678 [Rhizobium phaseoli Brasil 5]